jgi:CheY-like chemotaxis protein
MRFREQCDGSMPNGFNQPPRVLVVDDEPHVLAVMAVTLRRAGYEPIGAESAEHAIATLEHLGVERLPAAIISDIHMGGMDGERFAQALHEDPRFASIPIVIITGRVDCDRASLPPNVRELVRKPFSARAVIGQIDAILGRHPDAVRGAA